MIEITYGELIVLIGDVEREIETIVGWKLVNMSPEERKLSDGKLDTPATATLRAFIKKCIAPVVEEYNDELRKIQLAYCKLDEDGCIKYDEKGRLKFTPANDAKKEEAVKELKARICAIHKAPLNLTGISDLLREDITKFASEIVVHVDEKEKLAKLLKE